MALFDSLNKGADFMDKLRKARVNQAESDYAFPMAREGLAKSQLANKYQGLINDWYAPNIQSEIGLRGAQASHYPHLNRLTDAQAYKERREGDYIPTKYDIQNRNSLTAAGKLGTEVNNSFRLWSQTPEGQQIIQNRPDIANAVLVAMENQARGITGGQSSPASYSPENQRGLAQPIVQIPQPSPQQMPQQIPAQNSGGMNYTPIPDNSGMNNQAQMQPQQMQQPVSNNYVQPTKEMNPLPENATRNDLIKDIQRGAADSYERTNLPADTKKRLYAGERFKTTVPSVLQNFEQAKYYFSPSGQVQLLKDEKLYAATNARVPPQLQAYRKFKQGLEQLKVQGAFLEGVPADVESRSNYAKIYDVNKFFNNPVDAMDSVKYAINLALMADEVNHKSLSQIKSAGQAGSGNENNSYAENGSKSDSQAKATLRYNAQTGELEEIK